MGSNKSFQHSYYGFGQYSPYLRIDQERFVISLIIFVYILSCDVKFIIIITYVHEKHKHKSHFLDAISTQLRALKSTCVFCSSLTKSIYEE